MTILLFLAILVVLIVVHEFGHFVAAKLFGMRVDEFGIGYPPKALTFARWQGTDFTLNWLPFGGFVRIFGEDETGTHAPDSFSAKPKLAQAIVLIAGIAMNLVLAWVVYSIIFATTPMLTIPPEEAATTPDAVIVACTILPGSPAETAGLMKDDIIQRATAGDAVFEGKNSQDFLAFVAAVDAGEPLQLDVMRHGEPLTIEVVPEVGVVEADPTRAAIGAAMRSARTTPFPWWEAPIHGLYVTANAVTYTAIQLGAFFASVFTLSADLSNVSGPVGIATAIGDASAQGMSPLLGLIAIISINLALINLLPIPALDGGRLLFVLIEAIIRRPVPSKVVAVVNAAGFAFLIMLMVAVTASDIFKAVS